MGCPEHKKSSWPWCVTKRVCPTAFLLNIPSFTFSKWQLLASASAEELPVVASPSCRHFGCCSSVQLLTMLAVFEPPTIWSQTLKIISVHFWPLTISRDRPNLLQMLCILTHFYFTAVHVETGHRNTAGQVTERMSAWFGQKNAERERERGTRSCRDKSYYAWKSSPLQVLPSIANISMKTDFDRRSFLTNIVAHFQVLSVMFIEYGQNVNKHNRLSHRQSYFRKMCGVYVTYVASANKWCVEDL